MSENKFRSTKIYGKLTNVDSTDGTVLADANFSGNLTVQNNLILGNETYDSNGNVLQTKGNLQFTLNKIVYTIPLLTLSYLSTLTSNVQTQISNIGSNIISTANTWTNTNIFSVLSFTTSLNGMSPTIFTYLQTVTSDVQAQLNAIVLNTVSITGQNIFTNNTTFWNTITLTNIGIDTFINNGNSVLNNVTFSGTLNGMSPTIFTYLKTVTSDVQAQLNAIVLNTVSITLRIDNIFTQNNIFTGTNTFKIMSFTTSLNGMTVATFTFLKNVTSDVQTQLNTLATNISNIFTQNNTFSGTNTFGIMSFTTSLNGMTVATFNYLKNITSDVQTQLNNIYIGNNSFTGQNIFTNSTTFWNTITLTNSGTNTLINNGNSILNNITFSGNLNGMNPTTFTYLKNVTSDVQTQLNNLSSSLTVPISVNYQITRAYGTIMYNGTNYYFANSKGFNTTINTGSSSGLNNNQFWLIMYLDVNTADPKSPTNAYYSVHANGSCNNTTNVTSAPILCDVFNKGIFNIGGINYYGFMLTWTYVNVSVGSGSFPGLAVNSGYITVNVNW